MNQIINLIILLLTTSTLIQSYSIKTRQAENDCSRYVDDHHIIHAFPFTIDLDPELFDTGTTFAEMNDNGDVISIKIAYQECIPSLIYCFKHLSKLEIINTGFCDSEQRLPAEIIRLASSLTELDISDTKITELPNNIGQLKLLRKLKLSDTGLKSLPDSIGDLSSLTTLILDHNSLSSLPKTMINLRSLYQLTVSNNPTLYSVESLNGHQSLAYLDTSQSPIQILPKNLPKLVLLYMSDNKLTNLYNIESLGNESNGKKVFHFNGNNIQTITSRIRDVRNLYRLNLAHNQLKLLPKAIFNISTLHQFDAIGNNIHRLRIQEYISRFHEKNPNVKFSHD